MSLLGVMEVRWKVDGKTSGFKYSFVDYSIKGYSGQDHVKFVAVIQLDPETVQCLHPAAKKIITQSYNSSGFD